MRSRLCLVLVLYSGYRPHHWATTYTEKIVAIASPAVIPNPNHTIHTFRCSTIIGVYQFGIDVCVGGLDVWLHAFVSPPVQILVASTESNREEIYSLWTVARLKGQLYI